MGANMRPSTGNIARERRSAAWRRRRGFRVLRQNFHSRGGAMTPSVRPIPPLRGGWPQRARTTVVVLAPRVIRHFLCPWHFETCHGVSVDSMGFGAVEIGRIIAPDHRRRHQEAPKRCLATPAAFLRSWFGFLWREGGWGSLWLFQVVRCRCRAVKGKIYAGGF